MLFDLQNDPDTHRRAVVVIHRRPGPRRVYEVRGAVQFQPGPAILGGDEMRLDLLYDLDGDGRPQALNPTPSVTCSRHAPTTV